MWKNSGQKYGLLSIILHWVTALVIFGLFGLGWYMVDLTYYDDLYRTLPFIHQSVGIALALAMIIRIVWRWMNPRPGFPEDMPRYEVIGARLAHIAMLLLIVMIIVSGYLITTADGSGISFFDWFDVPATITTLPAQEDIAGLWHEYLAYALMVLAAIHALAALKHHFIDKDNTLKHMLGR